MSPWPGQPVVSHHLAVWLGEVAGPDWLLYCQLYSDSRECWVSERWSYSSSSPSSPSTLFTDVVISEAGPDLHLVVSLYRLGRMTTSQQGEAGHRRSNSWLGSANLYKRPAARGVFSLASLLTGQTPSPEHEITESVKLFTCEEKEFHQLHSMIIRATGKVTPLTAGLTTITLKMRLFTGFLPDIRDQHLDLKDLPETRKLGFAPIIMPGEWRNDLFVTLVRGQFDKGKPGTSARNIEVVLSVFSGDGLEVRGAVMSASSGAPSNSSVFYHNNNPCWEETFRLEIPVEIFQRPGSHLRLEFYHCSVKEKQERKLVGFSWQEVMTGEGTVIQDGEHELDVHRTDSLEKFSCATYLYNEQSLSKSGKVLIRTKLCSTKLTQNVDLMSLLEWKATPSDIPKILKSLMNTGRVTRCSQIYHFPNKPRSINIILLQRLSLQFLFKISNIMWNICNRLCRGGGDCQVFTRRPRRSLRNLRD